MVEIGDKEMDILSLNSDEWININLPTNINIFLRDLITNI